VTVDQLGASGPQLSSGKVTSATASRPIGISTRRAGSVLHPSNKATNGPRRVQQFQAALEKEITRMGFEGWLGGESSALANPNVSEPLWLCSFMNDERCPKVSMTNSGFSICHSFVIRSQELVIFHAQSSSVFVRQFKLPILAASDMTWHTDATCAKNSGFGRKASKPLPSKSSSGNDTTPRRC